MGHHSRGNFGAGFALGTLVGMVAAGVAFKNRKQIMAKVWQMKAKAEVHRRLRDMRHLTKERYDAIVDDVLSHYRTVKNIATYEIDKLSDDLKDRWESVKRQFEDAARDDTG